MKICTSLIATWAVFFYFYQTTASTTQNGVSKHSTTAERLHSKHEGSTTMPRPGTQKNHSRPLRNSRSLTPSKLNTRSSTPSTPPGSDRPKLPRATSSLASSGKDTSAPPHKRHPSSSGRHKRAASTATLPPSFRYDPYYNTPHDLEYDVSAYGPYYPEQSKYPEHSREMNGQYLDTDYYQYTYNPGPQKEQKTRSEVSTEYTHELPQDSSLLPHDQQHYEAYEEYTGELGYGGPYEEYYPDEYPSGTGPYPSMEAYSTYTGTESGAVHVPHEKFTPSPHHVLHPETPIKSFGGPPGTALCPSTNSNQIHSNPKARGTPSSFHLSDSPATLTTGIGAELTTVTSSSTVLTPSPRMSTLLRIRATSTPSLDHTTPGSTPRSTGTSTPSPPRSELAPSPLASNRGPFPSPTSLRSQLTASALQTLSSTNSSPKALQLKQPPLALPSSPPPGVAASALLPSPKSLIPLPHLPSLPPRPYTKPAPKFSHFLLEEMCSLMSPQDSNTFKGLVEKYSLLDADAKRSQQVIVGSESSRPREKDSTERHISTPFPQQSTLSQSRIHPIKEEEVESLPKTDPIERVKELSRASGAMPMMLPGLAGITSEIMRRHATGDKGLKRHVAKPVKTSAQRLKEWEKFDELTILRQFSIFSSYEMEACYAIMRRLGLSLYIDPLPQRFDLVKKECIEYTKRFSSYKWMGVSDPYKIALQQFNSFVQVTTHQNSKDATKGWLEHRRKFKTLLREDENLNFLFIQHHPSVYRLLLDLQLQLLHLFFSDGFQDKISKYAEEIVAQLKVLGESIKTKSQTLSTILPVALPIRATSSSAFSFSPPFSSPHPLPRSPSAIKLLSTPTSTSPTASMSPSSPSSLLNSPKHSNQKDFKIKSEWDALLDSPFDTSLMYIPEGLNLPAFQKAITEFISHVEKPGPHDRAKALLDKFNALILFLDYCLGALPYYLLLFSHTHVFATFEMLNKLKTFPRVVSADFISLLTTEAPSFSPSFEVAASELGKFTAHSIEEFEMLDCICALASAFVPFHSKSSIEPNSFFDAVIGVSHMILKPLLFKQSPKLEAIKRIVTQYAEKETSGQKDALLVALLKELDPVIVVFEEADLKKKAAEEDLKVSDGEKESKIDDAEKEIGGQKEKQNVQLDYSSSSDTDSSTGEKSSDEEGGESEEEDGGSSEKQTGAHSKASSKPKAKTSSEALHDRPPPPPPPPPSSSLPPQSARSILARAFATRTEYT